jgi:hypothetical protein
MSSRSASLIFGIREEAWPKGHGYLYVKRATGSDPEWLFDLDLYDTREDVVAGAFGKALRDAIRRLGFSSADLAGLQVETENMSAFAKAALVREWEKLLLGN